MAARKPLPFFPGRYLRDLLNQRPDLAGQLARTDLLYLHALLEYADWGTGTKCWPGVTAIQKMHASLSHRAQQSSRARLARLGLIDVRKGTKGNSNRVGYTYRLHRLWDTDVPRNKPDVVGPPAPTPGGGEAPALTAEEAERAEALRDALQMGTAAKPYAGMSAAVRRGRKLRRQNKKEESDE